MKKRSLLTGIICLMISSAGFAQQSSQNPHSTPNIVLSTPSLKAQVDKINKKQTEIDAAVSSSRAIMAQLKEELTGLNNEYKVLLMNAISNCTNQENKITLQNELLFVEQQLTVQTQR